MGELGYIVKDAVSQQSGLHIGDVIVAVRGTSLIKGKDDDFDSDAYKDKARTKLKTAIGSTIGVAEVVVGSVDVLRQRGWEGVQLGLDKFIKESADAAVKMYKGKEARKSKDAD